MIKVGIIGAAGYTGGELIRLLLNHPQAEIVFACSASNAGQPYYMVHSGLLGETDACFTADFDLTAVDVVFLCSGHGKSSEFWQTNTCPSGLKVIDLAQDYRDEHDGYIYGLPEVKKSLIAEAQKVANPGCFATAIQLALLPLAAAGKISGEVQVTAVTGSTGAGQKPTASTHFSWRNNNLSVYKAFEHQHLKEIKQTLWQLQPDFSGIVNFVPVRGDFPRGIMASVYVDSQLTEEEAQALYSAYYKTAAFTHVCPAGMAADLKQVVNTNKAILALEKHDGKLLIVSMIDNLLKGASGQAVQNMNLMFGLPENMGLQLKASAF